VAEATNGTEAWSAGRVHAGPLVLDLLMPDVDGFEVLRRLRRDRRAAQLPVLVVTGRTSRCRTRPC
jgi:CheY-like chemotaxis protein